MAISSPGIGSGLEVDSIIAKLMQAESRPLTLLARREASYQAKLSAYGTLKGAVSAFEGALSGLTQPAKYNAFTASVTATDVATVSADAKATAGSHSLEVLTLAQAQKLKSAAYARTTDALGSGTITIQFGTYGAGNFTLNADKATQTITIPPGSNSLAGVRDAINAANAGVSASIVNDGTGNRLVISSNDTGAASALRISVNDDDGNHTDAAGLSALAYDAATGGTQNLSETMAARDATLVIDGITITKSKNTITDALEGVTLNLTKANVGSPTTLTVSRDPSGVNAAVSAFVKAFNDLNTTIHTLSDYDAKTKTAGTLQGDSTVRIVQSRIRALLNTKLDAAGGGLSTLADIGLNLQQNGSISIDNAKLSKALNDPTKDIATLFAAVAKPTDSLVSFVSAKSTATTGRYALEVTQLATQGAAVGSVAANTTIVAGVNDLLSFEVDGKSGTITLAAGTYTADSLAAALQSKINGTTTLSDAGVKVSVTQSGGILTVASQRWGSESTVNLVGGTALAALFGTPTSTAGVDVAGTIGGATATGSGQTLSGQDISVKVDGGSLGMRGAINFARGYADQLNVLLDDLLSEKGMLAATTDSVNRSIKDIGTQREAINRRLTDVEARYRKQFTALDTMMASMQATSSYLAQQLANLPKMGSGGN